MNSQKLKEFINDGAMASSVYEVLMRFFLKKKGTKDVQMLASERMSALLLEDAWRELEKYRVEKKVEKKVGNVGL